jgi:hypothetical protein
MLPPLAFPLAARAPLALCAGWACLLVAAAAATLSSPSSGHTKAPVAGAVRRRGQALHSDSGKFAGSSSTLFPEPHPCPLEGVDVAVERYAAFMHKAQHALTRPALAAQQGWWWGGGGEGEDLSVLWTVDG